MAGPLRPRHQPTGAPTGNPTGEHHIYKIETHIERLSGDVASWQRMNRKFLNVLRKRFLVWRTLAPGIRQGYQDEAEEAFAGAGQQAV